MKKPVFLFGDSIDADESPLIVGNYRWLRKIGDIFLFLPIMLRMVPLSYLQSMSIPRPMEWNLTRSQDGVSIGKIINYQSSPVGQSRTVVGLLPGLTGQEFPRSEVPRQADLFILKFMEAGGNFPASEFRAPGWLHSTPNAW